MQKKYSMIGIMVLLLVSSFALDAKPATIQEGTYQAVGTNPNGTRYQGTCYIKKIGPTTYEFRWKVGREYQGNGEIHGRKITVHWGDTHPVIYTILAPDHLQGIWANGQANEVLKFMHKQNKDVEGEIESL